MRTVYSIPDFMYEDYIESSKTPYIYNRLWKRLFRLNGNIREEIIDESQLLSIITGRGRLISRHQAEAFQFFCNSKNDKHN